MSARFLRAPAAGALFLLLVLTTPLAALTARAADDAAWMFDPSVVVRIELGLSDEAREALAADPFAYVPAVFTMTYGARQYGPSAISLKLKGQLRGSFRTLDGKAAFKLKFPSGARPDGLKKLTLNNMVQDASKVHEAVSYEVFRAAGVAAPRTGYAEVVVNGEPYGLYVNVETMDEVALARWYASTQHLYEGTYGFESDPTDPFDAHYEVDVGDEDDRADLAALLAAATNVGDGWYARVAAFADLEQMTRMWAAEAWTGQADGYSGMSTNNYYLHADGAGRFTMLPWGTDMALVERIDFYDDAAQHVLFNGCVADPICGALYADAIAAVNATAKRLRPAARAAAIHRGLRAAIERDPKLEESLAAVRAALRATIAFASRRRTDVAKWAAHLPRAPRSVTAEGGTGTLAVAWARSVGRSATKLTGYAVEYRPAGGIWVRVAVGRTTTALTIGDLAPGVYEVRVRALAGAPAAIPFPGSLSSIAGSSRVVNVGG